MSDHSRIILMKGNDSSFTDDRSSQNMERDTKLS